MNVFHLAIECLYIAALVCFLLATRQFTQPYALRLIAWGLALAMMARVLSFAAGAPLH